MTVRVFAVQPVALPVGLAHVRVFAVQPVAQVGAVLAPADSFIWIDQEGVPQVCRWAQVFGGLLVFLDGQP